MTTALIVDDEPDMRMLLRAVLELANDDLEIVGEATDGAEAVALFRQVHGEGIPDVVILDNRMPHMTGMEAAEAILAESPDQLLILYSAFIDDRLRAAATSLGVKACLSKTDLTSLPGIIRELTETA